MTSFIFILPKWKFKKKRMENYYILLYIYIDCNYWMRKKTKKKINKWMYFKCLQRSLLWISFFSRFKKKTKRLILNLTDFFLTLYMYSVGIQYMQLRFLHSLQFLAIFLTALLNFSLLVTIWFHVFTISQFHNDMRKSYFMYRNTNLHYKKHAIWIHVTYLRGLWCWRGPTAKHTLFAPARTHN